MTTCANCGREIFLVTDTRTFGELNDPFWMHVTDGGGNGDCDLSATPVRADRAFVVESVPELPEWARMEIAGRLDNYLEGLLEEFENGAMTAPGG